ncbi:MAG: hypothetical protein J6U96_00115 [Elusimicrobiaceae bacterium]|nr:hypothetical protein [Elusimicrobiaceae bacterium]
MKRILFIFILCLSTTALFAQGSGRRGDPVFKKEDLEAMAQDVHAGFKNLHDRIKSKIQEKEQARKAKQEEKRKQQTAAGKQTPSGQTAQRQAQPQPVAEENLPIEQPSLYFNGHEFEATKISSENGVIRNEFVSRDLPRQVLILRQYPASEDPGAEKWQLGEGYPSDTSEIIFNKNFITSSMNQGQDVTVVDTRSPKNRSFQDLSLVRTVYSDRNVVRQYIYRFRIENPKANEDAVARSGRMLNQALDNLEEFNPKLVKGNYSF